MEKKFCNLKQNSIDNKDDDNEDVTSRIDKYEKL